MRIDVHAHYYPREFVEAYARLGKPGGGANQAPGGKVPIDERVDMLAEAGIDLQILCVGAQQPTFEKTEDAVAGARFANDLYADICKGYGGRYAAFAATPLPHVDAAIDEVGRCLETLGMLGVNTGTSVAGRPLDDPAFAPFFAELDRRRAVLFLHPQGIGAPMTDAYGLSWMIGGCFEDTVTSLRLVMSGLTTRYPNVKIIVPHLGGTLPFLMQRIDDSVARNVFAGAKPVVTKPSEAVRSLYWDTVNGYPAALRCSCEAFGADHIMLGTDFPYLEFDPCVRYIQESGLPEDDIDMILEKTAQRLLGLSATLSTSGDERKVRG
jgi:aminocarboxymuconate-semialdehyde decarboxylase